jgi:hypothetical protein
MTIFVEGGNRGALNTECRRGFRALIEKALPAGCRLRFDVRPCGSRTAAFDNFRLALESGDTEVILLVDGEDVITNLDAETKLTRDPWQHFISRGETWHRPARAINPQVHLMAVSMETWLVADAARLAAYYGQGFQASALPTHAQLEKVDKATLTQSLARATRNTTKGEYSKGSHSFNILATLNPAVVEQRSPHAKRFFDFLRTHC